MSAVPSLNQDNKKERIILTGDVPSPSNPPSGCPFHTRCPIKQAVCEMVVPREINVSEGRYVSCHKYDDEYRGNLVNLIIRARMRIVGERVKQYTQEKAW